MSIGNHITEISRQLWASLTGGWYYEPANSIFCNTLHLYIWSLLLILPLILCVITANGVFNFSWICAYVGFTFLLFGILKSIVGYLHSVFDTVDPIIAHKTKRSSNSTSSKPADFCRSPLSSFSARATESNAIEMVDFVAERSRILDQNSGNATNNCANSNHSLYKINDDQEKHVRIEGEDSGPYDDELSAQKMSSIYEDDNSSSTGSKEVTPQTTGAMGFVRFPSNIVNVGLGGRGRVGSSAGVLLLTDSLELLPISSSSRNHTNTSTVGSGLKRTVSYSRRKFSDPNTGSLSVRRYQTNYRRADERSMPIRRVHSSDNRMNNSVRSTTRGISPAAAFDSLRRRSLRNRKAIFTKTGSSGAFVDDLNSIIKNLVKSGSHNENTSAVELNLDETDDSQKPCCSNSLIKTEEIIGRQIDENTTLSKECDNQSLSNLNRLISVNKVDLPVMVGDLKGEITKFLEELIEKHPETLDAIENIRMNRLGRTPAVDNFDANNQLISEAHNLESGRIINSSEVGITSTPADVYQLNLRDGTHVAYDHEDTSQGAIHSFQDEHGNWWTYAFDDQSSGTAQALGSSRAIYEMFNKRRRRRQTSGSKSMNGRKSSCAGLKTASRQSTSLFKMPYSFDEISNDGNAQTNVSNSAKEDVLLDLLSDDNKADNNLVTEDLRNNDLNVAQIEVVPKIEVMEILGHRGQRFLSKPTSHASRWSNSGSNHEESAKRRSHQRWRSSPNRPTIPSLLTLPNQLPRAPSSASNSSSTSASLTSSSCYESPSSSSSNEEASDDAELAKYISDHPTVVFRPTTIVSTVADSPNVVGGSACVKPAEAAATHDVDANRYTRHNRYPSDSAFTSFLNMASRFYNPPLSGGGSADFRIPSILSAAATATRAARNRTERPAGGSLPSAPPVALLVPGSSNEGQPTSSHRHHHRRDHDRLHRRNVPRVGTENNASETVDSKTVEPFYKHLRRHHRRRHPRMPSVADASSALQALELLKTASRGVLTTQMPTHEDAVSAINIGGGERPNVVQHPRLQNVNDPIADGLRSLARRTLTAAGYTADELSPLERRNLSRDSGDSIVSAAAVNDAVFGRAIGSQADASARRDVRSLSSMRIFNDLQSIGFSQNCLRNVSAAAVTNNRTKISYYYKIKLIPRPFSMGEGFKIRIDRLSLSALFDRNHSFISASADVVLATMVSCLAAFMISANVYADFTLPIFAFVVAGSQFSLLKSVQPDAASPVHGFNWLISYSRPVYFCLLATLFLIIDFAAGKYGDSPNLDATVEQNGRMAPNTLKFAIVKGANTNAVGMEQNDIGWYWTANWPRLYSNGQFFFSLKDLISSAILFLPLAFTFGLLPQVDTMAMHIIEQIDIHFFGATASFSLLSSIFSLSRSITSVAVLSVVGHFAYKFGPDSTQNIAFSAFVALTISMAFLASRWSTNPLVYRLVGAFFRKLLSRRTHIHAHRQHRRRRRQNVGIDAKSKHKHNHRRSSNCSSMCSAESLSSSSGCLASIASSTTNNTTPFIKSFCCTAKFTNAKPGVVEISTAPPLASATTAEVGGNDPIVTAPSISEANSKTNQPALNPRTVKPPTATIASTSANEFRKSSHGSVVSAPVLASQSLRERNEITGDMTKENRSEFNEQENALSVADLALRMDTSEFGKARTAAREVDQNVATFGSLPHMVRSKSIDQCFAHGPITASAEIPLNDDDSKPSTYCVMGQPMPELIPSKLPSSSPKSCMPAIGDTMPKLIRECVVSRLHYDIFYFVVNTFILFGLHSTSVFVSAQPYFETIIVLLCIAFGFFNHYVYPQLRTHTPWKLLARPILRAHEFAQHETVGEARLMSFERVHVWMITLEKSVLYPLLVASLMSTQAWQMPFWKVIVMAICGFRIARSGFSQPQLIYLPLVLTFLLSVFGVVGTAGQLTASKTSAGKNSFPSALFLLYVLTGIWPKIEEFLLKLNFIFVYIAPWQISWGSAFHAFAQPFSVPHTGMICAQAAISSLLSAPLNPFLGSSFFLMSYIRPVKFWEKDYNTKRVDHSNLRLISQLDRGPMLDDSNLNAIFYEHLTRSLQKSLAGDLLLGRWATNVEQGDYFILASLYINCLVHIIEVGNGFVTFQVRGLEFRGTYCHQREVEAISEDSIDGGGCCCCSVGKLPGLLSFNNAWSLRWLAWEVVAAKYVIDGYSITDNSAVNLLQVHELRRLLVTLYVKCMIFYATTAPNFEKWLTNETVLKALEPIQKNPRFADSDQMFCAVTDEDYDINLLGISKTCFTEAYGNWIEHCWTKRRESGGSKIEGLIADGRLDLSLVTCFSFALSILGRRALGTASFNRHANSAESFLFGLHALFKGDMRITSPADEWVFTDPEILSKVISPAVRMSLKLHQDHFLTMDEFEDVDSLYDRIKSHQQRIFISHEHDPAWREAIIANTPSLLALRHIFDDGQDDYKIIMLNKMALNMRVIKLNRECVRAFWAGQQQELIFLRNRNPERGSIQNARQVLRNMINSSADQPIGYPIYVSPLVTSFVEMHQQVVGQIFGTTPLTFCTVWRWLRRIFVRLRRHFGTSGSSNLPPPASTGTRTSTRIQEAVPTVGGTTHSTAQDSTRAGGGQIPPMLDPAAGNPTAAGGQIIVGPAVSPAGSTPAPYRKHNHSTAHYYRRHQQHSSAPPSMMTTAAVIPKTDTTLGGSSTNGNGSS